MSAKPPTHRSVKVRKGNNHLTVYPWTYPSGKPGWRFAWRPNDAAAWRYVAKRKKDDAIEAAYTILTEMEQGGLILSSLPPARRTFLETLHREIADSDAERVLQFIRSLKTSSEIVATTKRYCERMESKAGEITPHLKDLRSVLTNCAKHFAGRTVAEIQLPELTAWLDLRCTKSGWKRKKDVRQRLVQFWTWAKREGIAGNEAVTVADRLPEIGGQHGSRQILTLDELKTLAREIREEWRAWLVLGCLSGLRPEEISPHSTQKKQNKRGLHCEEIDWDFGVIRVAPETSKVGLPRIIPMSDALRDGLTWAGIEKGHSGPVVLRNPAEQTELARLGKLIFDGSWPKDVCRHSYGSYRNAVVRNLSQVAEEMGTSVAMLHRHYHNPKPTAEGNAWFANRFSVPISADETEVQPPKASAFKKRKH